MICLHVSSFCNSKNVRCLWVFQYSLMTLTDKCGWYISLLTTIEDNCEFFCVLFISISPSELRGSTGRTYRCEICEWWIISAVEVLSDHCGRFLISLTEILFTIMNDSLCLRRSFFWSLDDSSFFLWWRFYRSAWMIYHFLGGDLTDNLRLFVSSLKAVCWSP